MPATASRMSRSRAMAADGPRLDGKFWLADAPDRQVFGTLDLSGRWPVVRLVEPLTPSLMVADRQPAMDGSVVVTHVPAPMGPQVERHLVHGRLHGEQNELTLLDCFTTRRGNGQHLQAAYALVGGHVTGDLLVSRVRVRLLHLDRWAHLGGLSTSFSGSGERAEVRFARPDSPSAAVPGRGLRLTLDVVPTLRESDSDMTASIAESTWLRLDYLPSVQLDIVWQHISGLATLLALATDAAVWPIALEIIDSMPPGSRLQVRDPRIRPGAPERRARSLLLSRPELDLEHLATWLTTYDKLRPIPSLVAAAIDPPVRMLEAGLLELAIAAEGLHRRLDPTATALKTTWFILLWVDLAS